MYDEYFRTCSKCRSVFLYAKGGDRERAVKDERSRYLEYIFVKTSRLEELPGLYISGPSDYFDLRVNVHAYEQVRRDIERAKIIKLY